MPFSDPARSLALQGLERMAQQASYGTRLWPSLLARSHCNEQQRAFATELFYGTLRLRTVLIGLLQTHLRQPFDKLPPPVQLLLLLGSYQLCHTHVPPHSAVHTSVALLPARFAGLKGLLNGVLRNMARRHGGAQSLSQTPSSHWPPDHLAWLKQELVEELGAGEAQMWWQSQLERPVLTVRIEEQRIPAQALVQQWQQADLQAVPHPHIPKLWQVQLRGPVQSLPGFAQGLCTIQDGGAYLVSKMCPKLPAQSTIIDMCAAPGGKTFHLAGQLPPTTRIIALDRHPGRMAAMQRAGQRLGHTQITYHIHDATLPLMPATRQAWFGEPLVDVVLCDAPCSGLGTLRRHPESSQRTKTDVARLAQIQQQLLHHGASWLKPNGYLLYSVCTVTRAEGPQQIQQFLQNHPEFEIVPSAPSPCAPSPDGMVRTWTHRYQTDSFFAALLRRRPPHSQPLGLDRAAA